MSLTVRCTFGFYGHKLLIKKGTIMTEKRIKTVLMLIGEALVIWYGMGTPVPKSPEEVVKLAVAILAITYTEWKNHDFTVEGSIGTQLTRDMKELRDFEPMTAEEPEDSFIEEVEENGDE